ncbi:hypothetical protein NXW48_07275 [Phocaeicola vulgatus]|nr:hypothetical protein [Phocaeicola vulgatus]
MIDYIDWAVDTFHFTADAKIGNQAPFYFDNSTLDIYLMMATGATLNIIPSRTLCSQQNWLITLMNIMLLLFFGFLLCLSMWPISIFLNQRNRIS